jgi:hypothetical protein
MTIASAGREPHGNEHPPHTATSGLLLAGIAIGAGFVALNLAFPGLAPTGIPTVVIRVAVHALILAGLWLGLARTDFSLARRAAIWLAIVVPFTVWLAIVWPIALNGGFEPGLAQIPRLPIAILAPVILGAPLLVFSKSIGVLLDAMPASWLIALQVYRVFGGVFLLGWINGLVPGVFALPAGTGDMLTGFAALSVAGAVASGSASGRRTAMMWNLFGLADLAVAITMGALSSPGPLQIFNIGGPASPIGSYPTVMIPAFAVPSSILLHVLSVRQLLRTGKRRAQSN